jgi:pyrroline-5-carboxylate reductase
MGTAIINGIGVALMNNTLENIEDGIRLFAYDVNPEKIKNVHNVSVTVCESKEEVAGIARYLFVCVKPQIIDSVLEDINSFIRRENTVVVSIAAGISGDHIQKILGEKTKVIQVMPNTPLMLGEGAVALAKFTPTTQIEFDFVKGIFNSCGLTASVPKDKMNEIIAINGSSPAFIYLFAKAFIEYGTTNGLDVEVCKNLFAQSLIGSAKMILESGSSIDDLIKQVSSPGGTTVAGLEQLENAQFVQEVINACNACLKRAIELGN